MLTEQLIANLSEEMQNVKPAASPYRLFFTWLVYAAAYIAIILVFLGVRPNFADKLHVPLFTGEILTLAAIIISSLLSASLLAFPDVYQKKSVAFLPITLFLLFAFLLYIAFLADSPPAPLPSHNKECLICISMLSLLPGGFILYNIRKYASTHYYMAGMVAALSAFSIGAMTLRISEKTDSIRHVIEWHYLPMIGVCIIGIFLGRLLKW